MCSPSWTADANVVIGGGTRTCPECQTVWALGGLCVIFPRKKRAKFPRKKRAKMTKLRQVTYLFLKAGNVALAGAWGFAQVFALVRVLDLADYSIVVITTAVGAYVLVTDLGLSAVLYTRVRHAFLENRLEDEANFAVTSLFIYGMIAIIAPIIFYFVLVFASIGSPDLRIGFAVHLLVMVLALPWTLLRIAMVASDHFILFESVEFARRIVIVALPFLMLIGFSYVNFVFLALLVWVIVFAVFLPILFRIFGLNLTTLRVNFQQFISSRVGQVKLASAYGLLEFFTYNSPYFIIPFISRDPRDLIAFDIFFKITRFGISGHHAINEALSPVLTQSLHSGNTRGAFRMIALMLLLSFFVVSVGSVTVTVFGDLVFQVLLDDQTLVPTIVRGAMVGFLAAGALHICSATVNLFKANYSLLASTSAIALTILALWAGAAWLLGWSFLTFMAGYAAIYATRSLVLFAITMGQVGHNRSRSELALQAG